MATKIRPIVFRVNEPEGFVMNASNASIANNNAGWESPTYPNAYDGEGKHAQIIIKESGCSFANLNLIYADGLNSAGGPYAISAWPNPTGDAYADAPVGTYDVTLLSNLAGTSGDIGKYLVLTRQGPDTTIDLNWLSKIEIRIID